MTESRDPDPVYPRNPIPARNAQSEERDEHFAVPLGSSRSGNLRFTGGAHQLLVRADSRVRSLFRARFGDRKPRVGVHGGIVTIRYPRSSSGDWTNCRSELTPRLCSTRAYPGTSRSAAALPGSSLTCASCASDP
jgi:hypothetical protein